MTSPRAKAELLAYLHRHGATESQCAVWVSHWDAAQIEPSKWSQLCPACLIDGKGWRLVCLPDLGNTGRAKCLGEGCRFVWNLEE